MDLLSDVPVWRVQAQGTSGKFSSYLVLLQFANDRSMYDKAQNMVSCCYNRRVLHLCAGRRIVRVLHVMITEWRRSRLLLHFQRAASNVKRLYFIYYIYFSSLSPGHTLNTGVPRTYQMEEVYTTQNSVSRKRSWYIMDTTNWCYNGYRVFPGNKADGRGVDHPHPSSSEVTKVELHLYSPSGHSWPVLGCTLPFILALIDVLRKGSAGTNSTAYIYTLFGYPR
jgi:hypothetical protein